MISVVGKPVYKDGNLVVPKKSITVKISRKSKDYAWCYHKGSNTYCLSCDGLIVTMPKAMCKAPEHLERYERRQEYLKKLRQKQ